jgi:hypothetical protein
MMFTLLMSARPARDSPPDAPGPNTAEFEEPKLNERMSIALARLVLGPGTPSIMQYAFTAISRLLYAEVEYLKLNAQKPNTRKLLRMGAP